VGEAVDAVGRAADEERQKALLAIESRLEELEAEGRELWAKAEAQGEVSKEELAAMRRDIDERISSLRGQLGDLRESGADAWRDGKAGVQDAAADLQRTFARAASRLTGDEQE
jgi:hypothetical protein